MNGRNVKAYVLDSSVYHLNQQGMQSEGIDITLYTDSLSIPGSLCARK
jgi:hypothetical protein